MPTCRNQCRGTWPSIEALREIYNVLDISADTLLGIEPAHTLGSTVAPDDPPMVRRRLGQLRQASRGTQRVVAMLRGEVEKRRKR